jgi:dTDP-4-dehydrorhamnose 3,5-epimerase
VNVRAAGLPGVVVLEPQPARDERGFFVRTLDADVLAAAGIDPAAFVQESQSRSGRHVLRGLHLRASPGEAKLVRCARGRVWDVVVDLRPWSPAFGRWESFLLDDEEHRHVYVPRGFGHGFQVLSEVADVCYHHDARYVAAGEAAVAWDDPGIGVSWPHPPVGLSERDRTAPRLEAVLPRLREWFPADDKGR